MLRSPWLGGASTGLYQLFKRMQCDGMDVVLVNLVNKKDQLLLRGLFGDRLGNPESLDNVYTCTLEEPLWRVHGTLANLVSCLEPDLLIGKGFIATRVMELAAPGVPTIFMTAGSRHLGYLIETGAVKDFMAFKKNVERGVRFPMPSNHPERQAVENAEVVIVHSALVKFAFDHFVPDSGKIYSNVISVADLIYPEAQRFAYVKTPLAERDIDLIFVAADGAGPKRIMPA